MRVARRADELKAAGRDIVDLGAGQPDFPSPPTAVEASIRALHAGKTTYTAAAGLPELRRALADRFAGNFGAPWTPSQAVITVGAKAALFEIISVVIDEGDEAIIPTPAWVSFEEQVRFAGGRPIFVPMAAQDRFRQHAEPLIAAISPRTRLILVNSPANPTGGIMTAADLRLVAEACADRGILLIADETYESFLYEGRSHASAAALAREFPDTLVLVGSFSKTYSMTGWRLGYALGPSALIERVIALQSHATSNPTSFAMWGALEALRTAAPTVEAMLAEFSKRRALVVEGLGRIPGLVCLPPDGAFYAFPDVSSYFRPGMADSLSLAEHLLESVGVALVPGSAFGADAHLRLSFATATDRLEEGLARLQDAFAALS